MPDRLVEQRIALHRLATYVIGPARHQHTGRFGLRSTDAGFGTPEFGDPPTRVRVAAIDGTASLIVEHGSDIRSAAISTLAAAAALIGSRIDTELAAEADSPAAGALDAPLDVGAGAIAFLGAWWTLGTAALDSLRADDLSVDPSVVQLWPGHFDVAIEVGDDDRRASFGASPGDDSSTEPYLYVSVWWPDRLRLSNDPFWNAEGFVGARRTYREVAAADDPLATATTFFRTGRDLLAGAPDA